MSSKRSRQSRDIVIGGSVTSFIGHNNQNVAVTVTAGMSPASLDEFRAAIQLLRAEIDAAKCTAPVDAEKARTELDKLEEELRADNPDAEMVGIRWKLVQRLLIPLQHLAGIAQATDRILTLIRTVFGDN